MGPASSSGLAQAFVNDPVGPAFQAGLWDERIARARSLASNPSPASEILAFYADLATFQRSLARSIAPDQLNPSDLLAVVEPAAQALPGLLEWVRSHGPAVLSHALAEGMDWMGLLEKRLAEGTIDEEGPAAFVVEAILQPFVESSVRLQADPEVRLKADATFEACCPFCGSLPVAAALREEGHGGRRSLVCSLCFAEWDYLRIQCPACKENRFDALPVYSSNVPANARIDACDTCRTYIKTIDLTQDGLAIPPVDDLATLPLDLWARDRGYQRLYPNLLRV
jgi:FdhE protein